MRGANKSGLGKIDKGWMDGTNIEAGVGFVGADKGGTGAANIQVCKKAGARVITSNDNSIDSSGKITNWRARLAGFAFAAFIATNYIGNSNLDVFKGIFLGAVTFTPNEFLATFAAFANITLEKELKLCKSNLFLFAANNQ